MFNFTKVDGKKLEDKSCSTLQKSMGKSLKKTKYFQLQKSHAENMSLRGHRSLHGNNITLYIDNKGKVINFILNKTAFTF